MQFRCNDCRLAASYHSPIRNRRQSRDHDRFNLKEDQLQNWGMCRRSNLSYTGYRIHISYRSWSTSAFQTTSYFNRFSIRSFHSLCALRPFYCRWWHLPQFWTKGKLLLVVLQSPKSTIWHLNTENRQRERLQSMGVSNSKSKIVKINS